MYDEPNPDETLAPTFTEQPPDVYAECRKVLAGWQKKRKPWPRMMNRNFEAAARWWADEMQEPWNQATEMPRLANVQGNSDKQRWISPYQDRVVLCLRTFLSLPDAKQRIIVAAREDGFWWRGEHEDSWWVNPETKQQEKVWCFLIVLREYERQRELGVEAYRNEALARMRKLRVLKKLPYDKGKRYGD